VSRVSNVLFFALRPCLTCLIHLENTRKTFRQNKDLIILAFGHLERGFLLSSFVPSSIEILYLFPPAAFASLFLCRLSLSLSLSLSLTLFLSLYLSFHSLMLFSAISAPPPRFFRKSYRLLPFSSSSLCSLWQRWQRRYLSVSQTVFSFSGGIGYYDF
jgi:hypothetical protein